MVWEAKNPRGGLKHELMPHARQVVEGLGSQESARRIETRQRTKRAAPPSMSGKPRIRAAD
jgi:hypothetical protein